MDIGDITNNLAEKWSHPVPAYTIDDLRLHIQKPLEEDEKIPISRKKFDSLCVPHALQARVDTVSDQQLSTLFRVSADRRAERVESDFLHVMRRRVPQTGTVDTFHVTYDLNISTIIEFILTSTTSIRNSNQNTSTALKCPDYDLLVNNYCLLRGEEKGSDTVGDPEKELVTKIGHWVYKPLPFILGLLWFYCDLTSSYADATGYYAETTNIHFVAITPPPSKTILLFSHNLRTTQEKVANIVHLIWLSGVLGWMGSQLEPRGIPEFKEFVRYVPLSPLVY